jgi:hypothetical protein
MAYLNELTNTVLAEPEGSMTLIPKSAAGYYLVPISSTSELHNSFSEDTA